MSNDFEIKEYLSRYNPNIEYQNKFKYKDIYIFIQWFLQIPIYLSIKINNPLLLYYFDKFYQKMEPFKNNIRGSGCSKEGKKYENIIYNIVTKCYLNNNLFNTQIENELGGCNSHNDIECNLFGIKDIPIEIKKSKTPDWMQCSINYDKELCNWFGSKKNKIPNKSKKIFEELINGKILFNGKIPPFVNTNITHNDWINIKKESVYFNDMYMDCPHDTIKRLYREKGCYYIQISEKGLYHLGEDICGFNVPEFICPQHIRLRTKIHTRKNNKGFCNLSITISCKPVNIKEIIESPYSIDSIDKLPEKLVYCYIV